MLKNKKILLGIFVIILLLILPNVVNAQATKAGETTETTTKATVNWSYELDGNSNAKNLKCTNVAQVTGELTIPHKIDGHSVISIGQEAFKNCAGLTGVTIPNSVTSIGSWAFSYCTGLTQITIPKSVKTIDSDIFWGCSGIQTVTFEEGITSIGSYAFCDCSGIKSISIPDTVTSIGSHAFEGCSGLAEVHLSNHLTKLENGTFAGCRGLTEIELPDTLTTIGSGDYSWYSPFANCSSLRYIKIPRTVVSIAAEAFENCKNLTIFGEYGSRAEDYAKEYNINFENIEKWDQRKEITGEDISGPTVTDMYIEYQSFLGYYNTDSNYYEVPRGVELKIFVTFNEDLSGDTAPTLTIKCGVGNNIDVSGGSIAGKNIVYTYTIQEEDEGLITSVKLEGGNVTDLSGNPAVLSVVELKGQYASGSIYANGKNVATDSPSNGGSNGGSGASGGSTGSGSTKDPTTATKEFPNTGKFLCATTVLIIAIFGLVVFIRYKKLQIK